MFKKIFWVFFISMIPVVELRGALPFAAASYDFDWWLCYILAVIGNMVPVPFLLIFGNKVLHYFASFKSFGKPFRKIIETGTQKATKIKEEALFLGLMLFVAIPLPGTGAWTGCLVAMVLQLPFKKAFLPIFCGVLVSGIIVTCVWFLGGAGIKAIFGLG